MDSESKSLRYKVITISLMILSAMFLFMPWVETSGYAATNDFRNQIMDNVSKLNGITMQDMLNIETDLKNEGKLIDATKAVEYLRGYSESLLDAALSPVGLADLARNGCKAIDCLDGVPREEQIEIFGTAVKIDKASLYTVRYYLYLAIVANLIIIFCHIKDVKYYGFSVLVIYAYGIVNMWSFTKTLSSSLEIQFEVTSIPYLGIICSLLSILTWYLKSCEDGYTRNRDAFKGQERIDNEQRIHDAYNRRWD